jgi:nitroreductase
MELMDAISRTGACREFTDEPVTDEQLGPLFEAARFGPQGGNRQPLRWVVVRDPATKRQLRDWYKQAWDSISGNYRAGPGAGRMVNSAAEMADNFDKIPVLVVVGAVLGDLMRTDSELDRPGIVGGASVYPSVQNFLLAARAAGLGATLTTLLCRWEPEVRKLLDIPDEVITAATIALGHPARPLAEKLKRRPASEVVFSERYGQPLFPSPT